jgi:catechol 2,3-dioxygenase-like lactoylglutathione lyase family enzyme
VARPVSDPALSAGMYCRGLGMHVIDRFQDHDGFDGVMVGMAGAGWHFEFTRCRAHPVLPASTVEDLTVFYLPSGPQWRAACARMRSAGFKAVASFNPYWEALGRTFEDRDGYRVTLQRERWRSVATE